MIASVPQHVVNAVPGTLLKVARLSECRQKQIESYVCIDKISVVAMAKRVKE